MTSDQVKAMTLEDLARLPGRTVGTAIAAHFLEMDRWNVTLAARQKTLPLPQDNYYFSGNRLHVLKAGLLRLHGYVEAS